MVQAELKCGVPKTMSSSEQLHWSLAAVNMRGRLSTLAVRERMRASALSATGRV